LCCGLALVRRDLLNSDDATCPHLLILGVTPLSSWVACGGQYRLDLSLLTAVVTL
jgi:hypothetical protein